MPRRSSNDTMKLPRASTSLYMSRSRTDVPSLETDSKPANGRQTEELSVDKKVTDLVKILRSMPDQLVELIGQASISVVASNGMDQSSPAESFVCRYIDGLTQGKLAFSEVCDFFVSKIGQVMYDQFEKGDRSLVGQLTQCLDALVLLSKGTAPASNRESARILRSLSDRSSTYFLNPEEISEYLTIEIETRALDALRGDGNKSKRGKKRRDTLQSGASRSDSAAYDTTRWNLKLQHQIGQVLRFSMGLESEEQMSISLPPQLLKMANKLKSSGACQGMQLVGAQLTDVSHTLQTGGYIDPEEFMSELEASCKDAANIYLLEDKPAVRRGKIVGYADAFVNLVAELLVDILGGSGSARKPKGKRGKMICESDANVEDPNNRPVVLPKSIAFNREPFRHGVWRKTPFKPRPYVRLESYHIVEELARDEISKKLKTKKVGGCTGNHCKHRHTLGQYSLEKDRFLSSCGCLSKNMECDAHCACDESSCLNRAVSLRKAVKVGVDVEEIDSWGMDCYTRKNIQDAILESQAFGKYNIPDYDKASKPVPAAATSAGQHAALVADAPSPPGKTPRDIDDSETAKTLRAASEWIELVLMPMINRQGPNGWNLDCALDAVISNAAANNNQVSTTAARAIKDRLSQVGSNYFRLHPKGVGLVCKREEGIPPLTFVEEYLGEIHTPWRWFELQDAVKRITGSELPDFYNIVLERPKDDPAGYDVLFVDAAAKGAVASRMSHSCTPNCQAVVMACDGRLTIALYTLRRVHPGEELTFDYSSVTESEKEFRQAICLCGTHMCRGSYLYFTGSKAFMQILSKKHNVLHRQVALIRASSEPLGEADRLRLKKFGLGSSCLGSVDDKTRVPSWLEKWTSLICEYLELEEMCLKEELLHKDPYKLYTEAAAEAEAKGVISNRVQNIVITLDKVRMFLKQPNQTQEPCLRLLDDTEVVEHLWNGPKSIARRLLRGSVDVIAPQKFAMIKDTYRLPETLSSESGRDRHSFPESVVSLAGLVNERAKSPDDARKKLAVLCAMLRKIDHEIGGGLTAAADAGILYAHTSTWVTSVHGYRTFTSPKVPINLEDLFLNRDEGETDPLLQENLVSTAHSLAKQHAKNPALRKIYRPTYVWGQLSGWFKQTVNDPTASLSAERRGAISLPDIESAFKTGASHYINKDRRDLLDQLSTRPDAMWKTGTIWQFRNESKYYGSPMLDQAWYQVTGKGRDPMPDVLAELRGAKIPSPKPPLGTQKSNDKDNGDQSSQRRSRGANSLSDIYFLG